MSNNRIGLTLRFSQNDLKAIEAAGYIIGAKDPKKAAKYLLLSATKAVLDGEKQRREEAANGSTEKLQPDTTPVTETERVQTNDSGEQES